MSKDTPGSPNKKRICIVFESTGVKMNTDGTKRGNGFNVFVEGIDRPLVGLRTEELTEIEFWASKMFNIITHHLKESGAVDRMVLKTDN